MKEMKCNDYLDAFQEIIEESKKQYLVYHLINTKTLNRYFGYVQVELENRIVGIGRDEFKLVCEILNEGEYLKDEKAIYNSIKTWGWENFKVNVVDFYRTEDAAADKVDDLIKRFVYYKQYDVYNGKDCLEESERVEVVDRDSEWLAQQINKLNKQDLSFEARTKKDSNEILEVKTPKAPFKSKLSSNTNAKTPIALIDKRTGEEIYFESKGECMKYLNTNHETFSKFLAGKTKKLNARYIPKKIVVGK